VISDRPVVVDRRLVTANGGVVSYQAALVQLGRLAGAEHAREVYDELGLGRLEPWDAIAAGIAAD
jgi:hypothetical protein